MSFDIYGGRLRSGHCEVHPDVAEPYPCSVCGEEMAQAQGPKIEGPSEEEYTEGICAESGHLLDEGHTAYARAPRCYCGKRTDFSSDDIALPGEVAGGAV